MDFFGPGLSRLQPLLHFKTQGGINKPVLRR